MTMPNEPSIPELLPGDPTPDVAFTFLDSIRTAFFYAINVPHLFLWMIFFSLVSRWKKPWEYERWAKRCARCGRVR